MNIIFQSKLAADCWHNLVEGDQHSAPLRRFMDGFVHSGWGGRSDPQDIPVSPGTAKNPRPYFMDITGYQAELVLSVCGNDAYLLPDGLAEWRTDDGGQKAAFPGGWVTREFDWIIWSYPVDEYGDIVRDVTARKKVMNGGFINHGSHDEPSWSSHT